MKCLSMAFFLLPLLFSHQSNAADIVYAEQGVVGFTALQEPNRKIVNGASLCILEGIRGEITEVHIEHQYT